MEILIAILALALLGVVVLIVSAPLRAARDSRADVLAGDDGPRGVSERAEGAGPEGVVQRSGEGLAESSSAGAEQPNRDGVEEARAGLEAEREAKYREIRDTELDYRTGKLSKDDFAMTDSALRAEALEILDRLAALESERAAALESERAEKL